MSRTLVLSLAVGFLTVILAAPALAGDGNEPPRTAPSAPAVSATAGDTHEPLSAEVLADAAQRGKYVFVFFYRTEDSRTEQLRGVYDGAVAQIADRAESVAVRVDDPSEKAVVDRFKVRTAPMPFVFVIAPNGAVVHSYRLAFSEEQLVNSFVSRGMEKALKTIQDGKMAILCIQNDTTRFDTEAMKGVAGLTKDPKYTGKTEVITIDPSDAAEAPLLKILKVAPETPEAVTVLIAPPGTLVGTFKGATRKKVLLTAITNAAKKKPCCAGGSSTCAPKK